MPRLAAKYIGASPVKLAPRPGDPYLDANGQPLQSLTLSAGDSLQIEEAELLGNTYLFSAANNDQPPIPLGTGLHLLPQHQGQRWQNMVATPFWYEGDQQHPAGYYVYEFHTGRSDFTPFAAHERQFYPAETPEATPVPPQRATEAITVQAEPLQASETVLAKNEAGDVVGVITGIAPEVEHDTAEATTATTDESEAQQ